MMKSGFGKRATAVFFLWVITCVLSFPLATQAAVPGLDLYNNAFGVSTWTFNGGGSQVTGLLHGVWVVDHDNSIIPDGGSHIVTVTYPASSPGGSKIERLLPPAPNCSPNGCYYEFYDGNVNQESLSSYGGTYTYRVEESGPPGSFSEATDDLTVAPVGMLDETSFAPKHSSPQAITAYFDDVHVNGGLYDDFSGGFNPDKWVWQPSWVTYENNQARFDVDFDPGRGSYWLDLKNPAAVNQLKATVKVTSTTGDLAQARIGSTAVRDHVGDIFASVRIRGNQATYIIGPERTDGNHFRGLYYVDNAVLGPVTTGNSYELSLSYDAPSQTYIFNVRGLNDSVNYSASYTLSGLISPALAPYGGIAVAGWVMTPTTPEFDWTPVAGANHYRVRIYGLNNNTIWRGYTKNPPYRLPPGILKPSSHYKYRIEAIGDHQWFEWDNASRSDQNLTRFGTLGEEAQTPYVDLASVGAETWHNDIVGDSMSFYVKVYDAQGVPQNIESVKVQVPGTGDVVDLYLDTNEGPYCGLYRGSYYGGVLSGNYVFTAVDKDLNSHSVADYVAAQPIASANEASLRPLDNALIGGTGVAFDWDDVSGASNYELQIYNENLSRLTILRNTDSQVFLPPGILKEGSYFRYRLLSRGEFYEDNSSNGANAPAGSLSDMQAFFTTGYTGGTSAPTIDIGNFGVAIWKGPHPNGVDTIYNLEFSALVTDADGVPANIRSVEVELPDGTKKALKYDNRPDWGFNYFEDETYTSTTPIQTGEYKFTVTDFDGNIAGPVTETLTSEDLAAAVGFGWATITAPADNVTLNTTTPTITWTPPAGAAYCRVRIMNAYGSGEVYFSDPIDVATTSLTLAPGILQTNRSYGIRVYSFLEPIGAEVDVYSEPTVISQMYVHFHIPDTVTGNDIVVTPLDQNTGAAVATLTFAEVTGTGTTTLASSSSGTPPPSGFALGVPPTYYEVETTASFSGSIDVCFSYSGVYYENESELKLYHYEDLQWVDQTTSVDIENDIICGRVTSLSPFALFETKYCKGDMDADGDGDGTDLQAFAAALATGNLEGDLNGDRLVNNSDLLILMNNFGHNDCTANP